MLSKTVPSQILTSRCKTVVKQCSQRWFSNPPPFCLKGVLESCLQEFVERGMEWSSERELSTSVVKEVHKQSSRNWLCKGTRKSLSWGSSGVGQESSWGACPLELVNSASRLSSSHSLPASLPISFSFLDGDIIELVGSLIYLLLVIEVVYIFYICLWISWSIEDLLKNMFRAL